MKENIGTKWSNDRFLWKIRPILAWIISGTKCDRDKLIFSAERGVQLDRVGHKKGTQLDRKMSKKGSIEWKFPTIFKYGSAPPPLGLQSL